jgi:hypothetical protein
MNLNIMKVYFSGAPTPGNIWARRWRHLLLDSYAKFTANEREL